MWEMVKIAAWIGASLPVAVLTARLIHLPQFTKRLGVVALVTAFCLAGLFPWSKAIKLGIDLSGGTILNYQVQQPPPPGFTLGKMVLALNRRINPTGVTDITIRPIGSDQVEITLPHASAADVRHYERILTSVGSLEFRILANRRDHEALIAGAEQTFPNPVVEGGRTLARWVPIAPSALGDFSPGGQIAMRRDQHGRAFVLAVNDPYNVTGDFLRRAESTVDQMGRPAVGFHFNSEGAQLFAQLTGDHLPSPDGFERRLAIVLDGQVYSAPDIRSQISADGIITGNFTRREVDDLVAVLNAGSLPAALIKTPVSEMTVGPTLGEDTIRSGLLAIGISTVAVLLFMVAYYRVAGVVADAAVLLNLLMVVGIMAWLHGTWTLPGLAGLALTVGMAVDTNVLIYERLREEQQRTERLSQAVDLAFRRAFRTIFDAHVTILLAGAVLYVIGSEQVRGFALTLVLGLAANLFTAVFFCRLIFDVLERKRWVQRFRMWAMLSSPHYDFVGKRLLAVAGSSLLILAGLAAVVLRGEGLLDIDFTGGTLAAIHLAKPENTAAVRRLTDQVLPDATVEELQFRGEPSGRRFLVRTTLQDAEQVKTLITREFGDRLAPRPFERVENFGGEVIQSTQRAAGIAILVSIVVIAAYLWVRFQNVLFGLATVVALAHDVLVALGLLAMSRWLAAGAVGPLAGRGRCGTLARPGAVQDQPGGHRRLSHPRRLLRQRHDRGLRPHPRSAGTQPEDHLGVDQQRRESDALPYDTDQLHDLAGVADPLRRRRRRDPWHGVLPGGRGRGGHLQLDLYCQPHADLVPLAGSPGQAARRPEERRGGRQGPKPETQREAAIAPHKRARAPLGRTPGLQRRERPMIELPGLWPISAQARPACRWREPACGKSFVPVVATSRNMRRATRKEVPS